MIYIFQTRMMNFLSACSVPAKAVELWPGLTRGRSLLSKFIVTGCGFIIYAVVIDYFMLDYLMLASGANHVIA